MANGSLVLGGKACAEYTKSLRHKTYQSLIKVFVEVILLRELWRNKQVIDEEFKLSARGSHGELSKKG